MKTLIDQLISQFQNIHFGHNWFGQSYKTKLQDLDPEQFFVRPSREIHSVAELIAHGTAWRKDAGIKITTSKGELTEASIEDWQDLNKLKEKGHETIIAEYEASVDGLIHLLAQKDDAFLETSYHDPEFGGDFPFSFALYGILQHDIYHLGQIGLVVKMLKELDK
jgi:uncharacterized damage-inducible protein DinB